jgi:tRNA threonylcarbamoyladenosine biosynthesis protein TsaE
LRGGDVVALYGELGTGKTSFVRGMAVGLGAPARRVSSPTFVLIHEYCGRLPLVHADLYRMDSASELEHLGLSDYLDDRHVVVIEWADKAEYELPEDRLEVHLRHRGQDFREIVMRATGARAQTLLSWLAKKGKADGGLQPARSTEHDRR